MTTTVARGMLTLQVGGLGEVMDVGRHHRAEGAWVLCPAALYKNFVQDWCITPAVLGGNVCTRAVETTSDDRHTCGLTHLSQGDLDRLAKAGQVA